MTIETSTRATFSAELTGFGVTLRIEQHWVEEYSHFTITGPRYTCTIPACYCDREPCIGSGRWSGHCKQLDGENASCHRLGFCHGRPENRHAEHVLLLAEAVLKTYGPNGRKVSPGTIGVPRGSRFLGRALLPLDGQETVNFVGGYDDDRIFHVVCDSARCRDDEGNVRRVASDFATVSLAIRAVEEHKAWHAEARAARLVGAR